MNSRSGTRSVLTCRQSPGRRRRGDPGPFHRRHLPRRCLPARRQPCATRPRRPHRASETAETRLRRTRDSWWLVFTSSPASSKSPVSVMCTRLMPPPTYGITRWRVRRWSWAWEPACLALVPLAFPRGRGLPGWRRRGSRRLARLAGRRSLRRLMNESPSAADLERDHGELAADPERKHLAVVHEDTLASGRVGRRAPARTSLTDARAGRHRPHQAGAAPVHRIERVLRREARERHLHEPADAERRSRAWAWSPAVAASPWSARASACPWDRVSGCPLDPRHRTESA